MELRDNEDHEGSLDYREHPEIAEQRDNQAEWEIRAPEDPPDNQDLMDNLEDKDNQENVDQEDPQDHEVQTEHQDNLDHKGNLDH